MNNSFNIQTEPYVLFVSLETTRPTTGMLYVSIFQAIT